jgi:polyhydroxyalkanoate synthase
VQRKLKAVLDQVNARQKTDPDAHAHFEAALTARTHQAYNGFLEGVRRYRESPFTRELDDPPACWQQGTTRLLDFSLPEVKGDVVLVIPSLINRYHVMDMDHGQSFVRSLAQKGFRPLLLDWDHPGEEEAAFNTDAYMEKRLLPALIEACRRAGGKVHVIGYCMGGLLATALAQLGGPGVKSLMCLATPWDFSAMDEGMRVRVEFALQQFETPVELWGEMPVDVLQCFFISLQPFLLLEKFIRFAALEPDSTEARAFTLIEDWVNDGVPLAGPLAQECLQGWYLDNRPALNTWRVMGHSIIPSAIHLPSLHVIPQNDKIVPPASAEALAKGMKRAEIIQPHFGHISMMTHAAAQENLWPLLFDWLASHASRP